MSNLKTFNKWKSFFASRLQVSETAELTAIDVQKLLSDMHDICELTELPKNKIMISNDRKTFKAFIDGEWIELRKKNCKACAKIT